MIFLFQNQELIRLKFEINDRKVIYEILFQKKQEEIRALEAQLAQEEKEKQEKYKNHCDVVKDEADKFKTKKNEEKIFHLTIAKVSFIQNFF